MLVPDAPEREAIADLDDVEVVVFGGEADQPGLEDVDVLVAPMDPEGRRAVVAALPRMRGLTLVQTISAGVDWIVDAVPDGVTLCSGRGVHDGPVAEWVAAALLADVKRLVAHHDDQRAHRWPAPHAEEALGLRVLIVGHGSIGRHLERLLAPFGMTFDRVARTARDGVATLEALPGLLPRADAVVLLVPATDATRRLAGPAFLAAMRDGALLVNAARGTVVDTDALLGELSAGRLRAIVDVTDPEPLPPGHPLWDAPGLLITPHVAGSTPRFMERGFALVRAQLERLRAGEPLVNVVADGGY